MGNQNETTFENGKIGDRVWDFLHGWGTIYSKDERSVVVLFPGYGKRRFDIAGDWDGVRRLFWDEVKIVAPPRPKRKVTNTAEAWMNIYNDGTSTVHTTEKLASYHGTVETVAARVHLTGTYEEEE